MEKYYSDSIYDGRVFVDKDGLLGHGDASVRDMGMIFIRNKNEEGKDCHLVANISYSRPHKWYYVLANSFGYEYDFDRTNIVDLDRGPAVHYEGFDYYVVWFKKENLQGLESVEIILKNV